MRAEKQSNLPGWLWYTLILLLLLPSALHVGATINHLSQAGAAPFNVLDRSILAVASAPGLLVFLFMLRRDRVSMTRLALATTATILTLVIGELALRATYDLPPPHVPLTPLKRVTPAADTMPGIDGDIEYSVNSIGLRGPETNLNENDLNILCVGGSTTQCLFVSDQLTWPWRLQDKLSNRLKSSVFVGNAGQDGTFTSHHLYILQHYPQVPQFDWVIILAGLNDMGVFLSGHYDYRNSRVPMEALTTNFFFEYLNGERQAPSPNDQINPGISQPYYRRLILYRLLDIFVLTQLTRTEIQDPSGEWYDQRREDRQEALLRETFTTYPEDFEEGLRLYRENLIQIVELARARGVRPLLMTQPTMYRPNLDDELQVLLWGFAYEDGAYDVDILSEMISRYNRATLEVCRDKEVDCIDLAEELPKDTSTFYDDTHFNISGCEKVSEVITQYIARKINEYN